MDAWIVGINTAFFTAMGVTALASPERVTVYFGLPVIPRPMRNEVRAVYGGFGIAVAGVLVAATRVEALRTGVGLTVGVALLGMAAGRLASFAMEGGAGRWPYVFLVVETVLGGSLLTVAGGRLLG